MIRRALADDAAAIARIYNHHVERTTVTFEELPVSIEEMARRIRAVTVDCPWLVAEEEAVVGYAYASPWKPRSAYRHTVEESVYVDSEHLRQGHGLALCSALLDRLREMSVHSVIAGIALPNEASIAFHERLGFEKVAHFREVGRKFDRWIDVGYWEYRFRAHKEDAE